MQAIQGLQRFSFYSTVKNPFVMGDHGNTVPDYLDENVSTKVIKIIQSYTGVIDKMVWRKY